MKRYLQNKYIHFLKDELNDKNKRIRTLEKHIEYLSADSWDDIYFDLSKQDDNVKECFEQDYISLNDIIIKVQNLTYEVEGLKDELKNRTKIREPDPHDEYIEANILNDEYWRNE